MSYVTSETIAGLFVRTLFMTLQPPPRGGIANGQYGNCYKCQQRVSFLADGTVNTEAMTTQFPTPLTMKEPTTDDAPQGTATVFTTFAYAWR